MRYIIGIILVLLLFQVQGASATILTNGGFESGTANWTLYTDGTGSFTVHGVPPTPPEGVNQANVSITGLGTNIQLYQYGFPITSGVSYTVSFSAYSNTGHDMEVKLIQHTGTYNNLGLNQIVPLGTGYANYQYTFNAVESSTNARLRLVFEDYEAVGDKFYIDNVILEQTTSTSVPGIPVSLTNTTGNFYINHSWSVGSGNITSSYNVSINGTWSNGSTATFVNHTLLPHTSETIIVYAYNNTGSLSNGFVTDTVTIPNNPVQITNLSASYEVQQRLEALKLYAENTDLDGDDVQYFAEAVTFEGYWDMNSATGVFSFYPYVSPVGTHIYNICVTDYYEYDCDTVTIELLLTLDIPSLLCTVFNYGIDCDAATTYADSYEWVVYQNE